MKPYSQLSKEELTALKEELEKQFEDKFNVYIFHI